ncbi:MAG: T9SS type A sorting domain-containing protein [Candidatus Cloacimonadales bacterium]|nr:T9SS type A sorting domain-containing protein [Candidatus Cloacimonadales bacterium]
MRTAFIAIIWLSVQYYALLSADSIIDSVYAVPQLDGNMCFTPEGNFYSLNTTTYSMYVGDIGVEAFPPPNSCIRSFVSFELPVIPNRYEIDSVYIRLYQFQSFGVSNDTLYYDFPYWDVPGGDTIQCIMSHIDYGFQLDPDDWPKGDLGNEFTFNHNIGMITDSGLDGYRFLNITPSVLLDYQNNRLLSQYRISFEIDSDYDDRSDFLGFVTGNSAVDYDKPKLFFYLSDGVGADEILPGNIHLRNHPNPFNPVTTINYNLRQNTNVLLQVYNLKGQIIKTLVNQTQAAGQHSVSWNAVNRSSGVYIYRLQTGTQTATGKCLLLK